MAAVLDRGRRGDVAAEKVGRTAEGVATRNGFRTPPGPAREPLLFDQSESVPAYPTRLERQTP
jgi:hypothetical protein